MADATVTPDRPRAPSAAEIDRRLRSAPIVVARPVLLMGLGGLKLVRRFSWTAENRAVLDAVEGPVIFAANHRSHTDTAAILGVLPHRLRRRTAVAAALDVFGPKAKGRSFRNEVLQFVVAGAFRAFAFDRHGPPLRSLRASVDLVRVGWSILLYPEGTRSRTGRLGPFKPGVGILARFTDRPVVPVHVSGGERVHPSGTTLPGAGRMTVRFGAPLRYREGESPAAFARRLHEHIERLGSEGGRTLPAAAAPRAGLESTIAGP